MPSLAQPYLRTSTDDKGQDPLRQMLPIGTWAQATEHMLLEPVVDEGTSGRNVGPFERSAFVEAVRRAKAAGAVLVVETPDRLTREGSEVCAWVKVELRNRFGVDLRFADEIAGNRTADRLLRSVKADAAAEWWEDHRKKIISGMARKKAEGATFGRPRRELTEAELGVVQAMRDAGKGWRVIAFELSAARGAFEVADPAVRKRRLVSYGTVRRRFEEAQALQKSAVTEVPREVA